MIACDSVVLPKLSLGQNQADKHVKEAEGFQTTNGFVEVMVMLLRRKSAESICTALTASGGEHAAAEMGVGVAFVVSCLLCED